MGKTPTILKIRSTLNQNSALPNYTPHVREPFFWKAGGRLYIGDGKTLVGDGISTISDDKLLHPINTYVPYLHARRKVGEDGEPLHGWRGNTYVDNLLVANGAVKLYCITENYKDNARKHDSKDENGANLVEYILTVSKDTDDKNFVHIKGRLGVSETLAVAEATTLNDTLKVAGKTTIDGETALNNTLTVAGKTNLKSTLNVTGETTLDNTLDVCKVEGANGGKEYVLRVSAGNVIINKPTTITDGLTIYGLTCRGQANIYDGLYVEDSAEIGGGLKVLNGGLSVTEDNGLKKTTVNSILEVKKNYIIFNNIRLYISSSEPTGNDIPEGSIGIGWGYSNG